MAFGVPLHTFDLPWGSLDYLWAASRDFGDLWDSIWLPIGASGFFAFAFFICFFVCVIVSVFVCLFLCLCWVPLPQ